MLSCTLAAPSWAELLFSSSCSVPVALAIDHSRPSEYEEANHETTPAASTAATARPISTGLTRRPPIGLLWAVRASSSGWAWRTKSTTTAVMRPSMAPMARWIGSISSRKVPNGSSLTPERVVWSTTAKAPICRPMIEAARLPPTMRQGAGLASLPTIGR